MVTAPVLQACPQGIPVHHHPVAGTEFHCVIDFSKVRKKKSECADRIDHAGLASLGVQVCDLLACLAACPRCSGFRQVTGEVPTATVSRQRLISCSVVIF